MTADPANIEVHYPDFLDLCGINPTILRATKKGLREWYNDLGISPKGIFLVTPPFDGWLSDEELAALPRHPTGRYKKPILAFPAPLSDVLALLDEHGLSDCIDPDDMNDWLAERSASAAPERPKKHDPRKARLTEIIEALEHYAETAGDEFDRHAMPGPLGSGFADEGSFHWLCATIDRQFRRAKDTFDKHRAGVCAVQLYAKQTDFYRRAMPHIAPIFNAKKTA